MEESRNLDAYQLRAWVVHVPRGHAPEVMKGLSEKARAQSATVVVLKADMVFGLDHLRSALFHARRALSHGTNSADSLEMETLLYASGERQLSTAIAKMGVTEETEELVVASLSEEAPEPGQGWDPLITGMDSPSKMRLSKFGITEAEMTSISPDRLSELVLERVAAVDLLKR